MSSAGQSGEMKGSEAVGTDREIGCIGVLHPEPRGEKELPGIQMCKTVK